MRPDLALLQQWIRPGARVLDLGCGDGELLLALQRARQVQGLGLDIDADKLIRCLASGLQTIQQDLNEGLGNFDSASFDTVVMTYALHEVANPLFILQEMLRVGSEAIVSFPNIGHWRCRFQLALQGRMPVLAERPQSWYRGINIHLCTLKDFEALCHANGFLIRRRACAGSGRQFNSVAGLWPNLLASSAVYLIGRVS